MKGFRRQSLAVVALAALVLTAGVGPARAGDPETGDGLKKVVKYSGCALGLAFAPNLPAAYIALSNCLMTFLEEPAY